jgi:hypothetical protein
LVNKLGVKKSSYAGTDMFSHNKTFHLNGKKYTIKDTEVTVPGESRTWSLTGAGSRPYVDDYYFNLYDAIAVAKAAGITNKKIAAALETAEIRNPVEYKRARMTLSLIFDLFLLGVSSASQSTALIKSCTSFSFNDLGSDLVLFGFLISSRK